MSAQAALSMGKPFHKYRLLPRLGAEFVGTFMVILVGVGYGALANPSESPLLRAAAFGLALVGAMFVFAPISGGHLNPAVTLGVGAAGRMPIREIPAYIVAQVVGAVAGMGVIFLAFNAHPQLQDVTGIIRNSGNGFDANSPAQFPLTSVLLIETVATALLVTVYLGISHRKRNTVPLAVGVGFSYLALLAFTLPLDQGGLNPARSTAVAVFGLDWVFAQLWLFWVAPLVGALIAGLLFRSFDLSAALARKDDDEPDDSDSEATDTDLTDADVTDADATVSARDTGIVRNADEDNHLGATSGAKAASAATGTSAAKANDNVPSDATGAKEPSEDSQPKKNEVQDFFDKKS